MNTGTRLTEDGAGTDLKSEHKIACATCIRAWKPGELVSSTRPMEAIIWKPEGPCVIFIKEGDAMVIISAREIDALCVSVYEFEFLYGGIKCDYSVHMDHNFDVEYDFPFKRI